MRFLRPLPRPVSRLLTAAVLLAWAAQMTVLVRASAARSSAGLAADLARYGTKAHWKGIYYRGEKIGYSVAETLAAGDGYEIHEEAQIQMSLLGASTASRITTRATVDSAFTLRSFSFGLDPGTGPITIEGTIDGRRLALAIETAHGRRTETRDLAEPPSLSLNLPHRLAAMGLEPGKTVDVQVFDPATLRNATMTVEVQAREVVRVADRPTPAFRVQTRFAGITSLSWITDVGDVVREESPTGFLVVRETRERATARAVSGSVQADLLDAVAIRPKLPQPIHDPRGVRGLALRIEGIDLDPVETEGVGQRYVGAHELEISDLSKATAGPADPDAARYLGPEPLLESDAPEIVAEAQKAVGALTDPRARAEKIARYVNALLEKKPTMSLPSALEVLRTKVGDCNEHTALYVAMARAQGLPARIAVGLVYLRGAFYYHAWAEVYVEEAKGRGLWLAVDPTLNEFPADATHVRLARGGLDKQAAILPLIGRGTITVTRITLDPDYKPILVGRGMDAANFSIPVPRRDGGARSCWSKPGN